MMDAHVSLTLVPQRLHEILPSRSDLQFEPRLRSARRLQDYLLANHWDGRRLIGPDVGVRFNSRLGRFIKGLLPQVQWNDNYCYMQAQGYWVLANWRMYELFGESRYRAVALRCSDYMVAQQRKDGAWGYPNPEWRGRVATAEGVWGSLGLLESFRQTGSSIFLDSVLRWHRFMVREIGFQSVGDGLAANYFHRLRGVLVPNNSGFVLRFLAELAEATGNASYLHYAPGLRQFLQAVQTSTGEFPYTVQERTAGPARPHFQCFQYNAFLCLDLMRYYDLTGDEAVLPLVWWSLAFLRRGLDADGRSYFDCDNRHQEVNYHTAVLAQALSRAAEFGIPGFEDLADRAYGYLVSRQRPGGAFDFSRGDYFVLRDARSYPRSLAMILFLLLPLGPSRAVEAVSRRAANIPVLRENPASRGVLWE